MSNLIAIKYYHNNSWHWVVVAKCLAEKSVEIVKANGAQFITKSEPFMMETKEL